MRPEGDGSAIREAGADSGRPAALEEVDDGGRRPDQLRPGLPVRPPVTGAGACQPLAAGPPLPHHQQLQRPDTVATAEP